MPPAASGAPVWQQYGRMGADCQENFRRIGALYKQSLKGIVRDRLRGWSLQSPGRQMTATDGDQP